MTFFETIRGVEIEVFAERFEGDPSIGLEIGPEEVWAKTLDGKDFYLRDEEVEQLATKATEIYLEDDPLNW